MPKVTIIIPSYNHERFLKERLDTIIHQSFQDFEIIIIDDCSIDNSLPILKEFSNTHPQRIKHFIVNEFNSGSGYQSWKKGINLSETEYIWIAETDDYSDTDFLKTTVEVLDFNPDVSLVFCNNYNVDQYGNISSTSEKRTSKLEVKNEEYAKFELDVFLQNMPFKTFITNGSSVVFRKPKEILPDFIFSYKQMSDAFLWTFILQKSKFAFINKKLNYFRRHDNSTTVRMSKTKAQLVYYEQADYLNYFNLHSKHSEFIKHYVFNYVWNHKQKTFDFKVVSKLDGVFLKYLRYFRFLGLKFFDKTISYFKK